MQPRKAFSPIAVTGLQLATATCAAINGGNYYTPYLVSEIYDNNGIVAQKIDPQVKHKVVSEQTSKILNSFLLNNNILLKISFSL